MCLPPVSESINKNRYIDDCIGYKPVNQQEKIQDSLLFWVRNDSNWEVSGENVQLLPRVVCINIPGLRLDKRFRFGRAFRRGRSPVLGAGKR